MSAPLKRPHWHDAYDAQMEVWRWHRTPTADRYRTAIFDRDAFGLSGQTQKLLAQCLRISVDTLPEAEPVFVSEGMCDVVEAAAESFKPEPLLPTDLFTRQGFLYWQRPLRIEGRHGRDVMLRAVSWSPVYAFAMGAADMYLREGGQQRVTEEVMRDLEAVPVSAEIMEKFERHFAAKYPEQPDSVLAMMTDEGGLLDGIVITLYEDSRSMSYADLVVGRFSQLMAGSPPSLTPIHFTPWWLGMSYEGNEVDENGEPTAADWWWRTVQTTLRLMQQRIASHHQERPHRAARREALRAGMPEREIVVVRLRRESHDGEPSEHEGEARYSHRFIVSGHWRNQWYPASQVHRQIWISPYVKGPEDGPLMVRPRRVYQWTR